jgi:hypothetical protein
MKLSLAAGIVVVAAAVWLILAAGGGRKRGVEPDTRGVPGITFLIPADYAVITLGESTLQAAADTLLQARKPAAAVFTASGDRIQLLIDRNRDMIDERIFGREGTVRRVLWPDSAEARLRWARTHGDLAVPGLSPPEYRNPYH